MILYLYYLSSALPEQRSTEERGSRSSQFALKPCCERMRATEHAPRDPFRVLERRHCLAEIVERGSIVHVERVRQHLPNSAVSTRYGI